MRKRCPWIHDHKAWTRAEEDFLWQNRGKMSAAAMAAALPGRTKHAVQSRCQQLGIFKRDLRSPAPASLRKWVRWSTEDIDILRGCAGVFPEALREAYFQNRTDAAIRSKMSQLGIPTWTAVHAMRSDDLEVAA